MRSITKGLSENLLWCTSPGTNNDDLNNIKYVFSSSDKCTQNQQT